jgi:hypothetical protein
VIRLFPQSFGFSFVPTPDAVPLMHYFPTAGAIVFGFMKRYGKLFSFVSILIVVGSASVVCLTFTGYGRVHPSSSSTADPGPTWPRWVVSVLQIMYPLVVLPTWFCVMMLWTNRFVMGRITRTFDFFFGVGCGVLLGISVIAEVGLPTTGSGLFASPAPDPVTELYLSTGIVAIALPTLCVLPIFSDAMVRPPANIKKKGYQQGGLPVLVFGGIFICLLLCGFALTRSGLWTFLDSNIETTGTTVGSALASSGGPVWDAVMSVWSPRSTLIACSFTIASINLGLVASGHIIGRRGSASNRQNSRSQALLVSAEALSAKDEKAKKNPNAQTTALLYSTLLRESTL